MITSWKELVYTLRQMRQLQKNPETAGSLSMGFRLKQAEADVDACVNAKIEEWNAPPEDLFSGAGAAIHNPD